MPFECVSLGFLPEAIKGCFVHRPIYSWSCIASYVLFMLVTMIGPSMRLEQVFLTSASFDYR